MQRADGSGGSAHSAPPRGRDGRTSTRSADPAITTEAAGSAASAIPWRRAAAIFVAVAALYLATRPGNVSEAEDGFAYATVAELPNPTWQQVLLPDHVLFYPLVRTYLALLHLTGWDGRAYGAVVTLDVFAGAALAAAFYLLLVRRVAVGEGAALLGALLLACSYGPWRYAVEVEIPTWTSLAAVALLHLALLPARSVTRAFGLGIAAAGTIAMHGLNVLLAGSAIPAWVLLRNGVRQMLAYGIGAALALTAIVGSVFALRGDLLREVNRVAELSSTGARIAKGLVGLAQAVVSGNFLFGSPRFAAQMSAAFPEKMLAEEIFMGRQAPAWLFAASVATAIALAGASAWLMFARWRVGRSDSPPPMGRVFVLWSVVYGLFAIGKNPGSFELWVPALVPLWTLVAVYLLRPLLSAGRTAPCVAFAACLLLHNVVGGFAWIHDPDSDYNRVRAAWLVEHATAADLIVTADTTEFSTWLRYWGRAVVLDTYKVPDERLAVLTDTLETWTGAVYVTDAVLSPPSCLCLVREGFCERLAAIAGALRPALLAVDGSGDATVYEWRHRSTALDRIR